MDNPWKLATLGFLALGAIVGTSTLTTAYLLRPPVSPPEHAPSPPAPASGPRAAVVRVTPAAKKSTSPVTMAAPLAVPAVAAPAESARAAEPTPAPLSAAVITPAAQIPAPVPPVPTVAQSAPSAAAARPADCETGGDRAARIAKPGALGAVLGAGLGAAGGAMAKGGKGAGQGALIGGLAGAALGAGYGAYTTKTECGTVFGDNSKTGASAALPRGPEPVLGAEAAAPFQVAPARANRIHIYDVR